MMTHPKISIVQNVKYGVLFLPIAWLIFSTWVLISEAFPRFPATEGQEANPQPSVLDMLSLIYFAAAAVWILIKILRGVRNRQVISSEQKSGFAFFLGTTLMGIENYFPLSPFLFYLGMILIDIAAIIMIVTLVQGRSFGVVTLYHKDIRIEKVS